MNKEAKISQAQRLFDAAFAEETYRDQRSDAYKRGVLDALRFKTGEGPSPKATRPYELGTAECDAWFSGLNEGYSRGKHA